LWTLQQKIYFWWAALEARSKNLCQSSNHVNNDEPLPFYDPRFPNNMTCRKVPRLRPVVMLQQHLSWCRQAASTVQLQLNKTHSPAYVVVLTKTNRLVALGRHSICLRHI
jgi:hypothetical protein